jgi:hypothetical protein
MSIAPFHTFKKYVMNHSYDFENYSKIMVDVISSWCVGVSEFNMLILFIKYLLLFCFFFDKKVFVIVTFQFWGKIH